MCLRAAEAPPPGRPQQQPLRLFDFLWSTVWCLQLFKEHRIAQRQRPSATTLLLVTGLAANIAVCAVASLVSQKSRRLGLAASGLAYLSVRGSSSNHVVLQALVCCLVLESDELKSGARSLLGALYFVTALAKCNAGFFRVEESCAVLYAVAGGATAGLPPFPRAVLRTTPYLALSGEVWLAVAFWRWDRQTRRTKFAVLCAGLVFHCGLAAPAPPLSVYPFSLLMAPLFALADDHHGDLSALAFACILVFPVVLSAVCVVRFESALFEYPPYASWRLGLSWCCAAFAAVLARPFFDKKIVSTVKRRRRPHVSTVLTFVVGALPYLGLRTHPAFVMFSNVRLERASNHWFFTDAVLRRLQVSRAARDVVTLTSVTNFPDVVSLRVDLGRWIQHEDLIHRAGASSEFLISPPARHWTLGPADLTDQESFSVPYVELRRRVSAAAAANSRPFDLAYERGNSTFRLRRFENGTLVGDDLALLDPLPLATALLHRFRAFDSHRSPCRH